MCSLLMLIRTRASKIVGVRHNTRCLPLVLVKHLDESDGRRPPPVTGSRESTALS